MGENRQLINPALGHAGGGLQASGMGRLHQVASYGQQPHDLCAALRHQRQGVGIDCRRRKGAGYGLSCGPHGC